MPAAPDAVSIAAPSPPLSPFEWTPTADRGQAAARIVKLIKEVKDNTLPKEPKDAKKGKKDKKEKERKTKKEVDADAMRKSGYIKLTPGIADAIKASMQFHEQRAKELKAAMREN
jgi:hypothetical protein